MNSFCHFLDCFSPCLLKRFAASSPQGIKLSKYSRKIKVSYSTLMVPLIDASLCREIRFPYISFYWEGQCEDEYCFWFSSFTWSKCYAKSHSFDMASVTTAVSDESDVFVKPFEGLTSLIKNKGKHGSPLKAILPVLYFFLGKIPNVHVFLKMTVIQFYCIRDQLVPTGVDHKRKSKTSCWCFACSQMVWKENLSH